MSNPIPKEDTTRELNFAILEKACDWFWAVKAPDLKDKVNEGLNKIRNGEMLEPNWKKLFGFLLFSYAMANGPLSFSWIQKVVEQYDLLQAFEEYAKSWIDYSDKNKKVAP